MKTEPVALTTNLANPVTNAPNCLPNLPMNVTAPARALSVVLDIPPVNDSEPEIDLRKGIREDTIPANVEAPATFFEVSLTIVPSGCKFPL